MLFNSIDFAVFLPIVFLLYWFVFKSNIKIQNFFIVAASFVFYGWWNWKFLVLMVVTIFLSWLSSVAIEYIRYRFDENIEKKNLWFVAVANITFMFNAKMI